jgi:hypothetical protein
MNTLLHGVRVLHRHQHVENVSHDDSDVAAAAILSAFDFTALLVVSTASCSHCFAAENQDR